MYNIGLDIGTGSVGWCLTDENGYLLKVNRKGNNGNTYRNSAWGVRCLSRQIQRLIAGLKEVQEDVIIEDGREL